MSIKILKTYSDEDVSTLILPSRQEHCITALTERSPSIMDSISNALTRRRASMLSCFVFGGCQHYEQFKQDIETGHCSAAWLQGDSCQTQDMFSAQVTAVSGITPLPVKVNGRIAGFFYEDDLAGYCRLNNILPQDLETGRAEQTRSVFETMARALEECDMAFTDTVRTWLYLADLLDWYGEFNSVRTSFFEEKGIFEKTVPASTGIGARSPADAAITAGLLAVRPKSDKVKVQSIVSPLQPPALDYKSSFSRAVEVSYPEHRVLYVSGTAGIDEKGLSICRDDPAGQIKHTMRVVISLLKSRDMGWEDVVRGIIYYTDIRYHDLFTEYCKINKIPRFPTAVSMSDVCRKNLLFEIEVDAVKTVS